jgi:hAT family C-terminal dimerisation region
LTLQREYLHYKARSDEFAHSELWDKEVIEHPRDFWDLAAAYAPTLISLARRLLRTTSNSVPCERAFSTIKLNHTRDRNRLKITTIDKLCFIHINKRVLDREEKEVRTTHIIDLKEAEEVELEDIMASLGDSRPQNTEMEGEEGNTTQDNVHNTQISKNGNGKRPREDVVDEASQKRYY